MIANQVRTSVGVIELTSSFGRIIEENTFAMELQAAR